MCSKVAYTSLRRVIMKTPLGVSLEGPEVSEG